MDNYEKEGNNEKIKRRKEKKKTATKVRRDGNKGEEGSTLKNNDKKSNLPGTISSPDHTATPKSIFSLFVLLFSFFAFTFLFSIHRHWHRIQTTHTLYNVLQWQRRLTSPSHQLAHIYLAMTDKRLFASLLLSLKIEWGGNGYRLLAPGLDGHVLRLGNGRKGS
jgi:hypothetical protein